MTARALPAIRQHGIATVDALGLDAGLRSVKGWATTHVPLCLDSDGPRIDHYRDGSAGVDDPGFVAGIDRAGWFDRGADTKRTNRRRQHAILAPVSADCKFHFLAPELDRRNRARNYVQAGILLTKRATLPRVCAERKHPVITRTFFTIIEGVLKKILRELRGPVKKRAQIALIFYCAVERIAAIERYPIL